MKKITYAVVSEFAGHRTCEQVAIQDAVSDIYGCVKEKGMEMAINDNSKNLQAKAN